MRTTTNNKQNIMDKQRLNDNGKMGRTRNHTKRKSNEQIDWRYTGIK